jgi:hypothetical protein
VGHGGGRLIIPIDLAARGMRRMSGKRPAAHRCCGVFIVRCQTESLKRLSDFAIRQDGRGLRVFGGVSG